MNKLEQLRHMTHVVADTGDIAAIARYKPRDATTNPSLLLKAASLPQYATQIERCIREAHWQRPAAASEAAEILAVAIGTEISKLIDGYISTEVHAATSFDVAQTVATARRIVARYEMLGVPRERILVKIASTWQGIQAARILEQDAIQCNLTLLFHMAQARAAADARATLISPFVGRILDWYQKSTGQIFSAENDPGVQSVRDIFRLYKHHGVQTIVMGASFRNCGQIEALAGCDKLTISPELLAELETRNGTLQCNIAGAPSSVLPIAISEAEFHWQLNACAMSSEKLADGIRRFHEDQTRLEAMLRQRHEAIS